MPSPQKPEWVVEGYNYGHRQGVRLVEATFDWHLRPAKQFREIKKWPLRRVNTRRGHIRFQKAVREAEAMKNKLDHAWPCTFLVKGYPYRPPPEATSASDQDKVA